jgi:hypothetical protein
VRVHGRRHNKEQGTKEISRSRPSLNVHFLISRAARGVWNRVRGAGWLGSVWMCRPEFERRPRIAAQGTKRTDAADLHELDLTPLILR